MRRYPFTTASLLAAFTCIVFSWDPLSVIAEPPSSQSTATSTETITNPEQAFAGIPPEILKGLKPGAPDLQATVVKANEYIRKNIEGKQGTLKFTMHDRMDFKDSYLIGSEPDTLRIGGTVIKLVVGVMFDGTQNDKLLKLKPGSKVKATGRTAGLIYIDRTPQHAPVFNIELAKAKLD